MKFLNPLILILLLLTGFILKDEIHISSNLISLFSTPTSTQKIKIASELGYTKEMLVAVKGFDAEAKVELSAIAQELRALDGISYVQESLEPSAKIQEFYKDNFLLLADFDNQNLTQDQVHKKMQALYSKQLQSIFYTAVNRNDPLGLFSLSLNSNTIKPKGKYLRLEDYGYMLRVKTKVEPSDMTQAKILYEQCQSVFSKHKDVVSFSPFFYTVENSSYIKGDVQNIILLSSILLFFVYFFLLKNLYLLFETLTALFSSMVFAALISTIVFDNFHILSLAFGMSITAVSIDYLLHYHLHGFYTQKSKINISVLLGFLTTIIAFGIFSFIPIPLISQISFFAVLSLSFAYVLFTFVFKNLKIKPYEKVISKGKNTFNTVPSIVVFIGSTLLLIYSVNTMNIDSNIRNLDYQNDTLRKMEGLFKSTNQDKLQPLIVEAKSQDELLANLHLLKKEHKDMFSLATFIWEEENCKAKVKIIQEYDFKRLNKSVNTQANAIGFKKDYFKEAYNFTEKLPSCSLEDINIFDEYNLGVYKDKDTFYTMAFVKDLNKTQAFDFTSSINLQEIFSKIALKMYDDLFFYGSIVIGMIIMLLMLSVRRNFLYALNYILFPVSFTLAILVNFVDLNLMHFFAMIILVAIGIDYGIYMSNTENKDKTILAIFYSLLSTFAGFGVLVASSVVALHSIGVVVSLGVGAIFILIKVMK